MDSMTKNEFKPQRQKQIFAHYAKVLEIVLKEVVFDNDSKATFRDICDELDLFSNHKQGALEKLPNALAEYISANDFRIFVISVAKLRNAVLHGNDDVEDIASFNEFYGRMRNLMIGVGCQGVLNTIYTFYHPTEIKSKVPSLSSVISKKLKRDLGSFGTNASKKTG